MTVVIYLPFALTLALALATRWIAERGIPGTTAGALSAAALFAAAASTWSLLLLSLTLLDDVPPLSALDNHATLELPEPVPGPIALLAALGLAAGVLRLLLDLRRRHRTIAGLQDAGRPSDGVVVADWSAPMAVAVPGRPGHLLVTSGMLRLLDAGERRVLFAHERSHIDHRHHRLACAAAAAAALNPVLIPVRNTVAYLVERQADEDAAAVVGDRGLTAQAVARAALAASPPPAALSIGGGPAVRRVRALGEPGPAPRRRRLLGAAVLAAGILAASTVATAQFVALARVWF